jgi:Fe-S cluster assembly protein SufD
MSNLEHIKEFKDLYSSKIEGIDSPAFVQEIRKKSIEAFTSKGFPNRKNEDYKYTDIEAVFNKNIHKVTEPRETEVKLEEIFKCDVPDLDANAITVLNGFYYSPDGETLKTFDNGIIVGSLATAIKEQPEIVSKYLNQLCKESKETLVSLNSAFLQDGIFLYVPEGAVIDKPLQIVHLMMDATDIMAQHRNLFVFEKGAEGKVVICDHSLSPANFITNSVTEIVADENSNVEVIRMQNEHNESKQFTNTFVKQRKDSKVVLNTLTLHGGVVRNNVFVDMVDENCENNTFGLYLADRNQHVDNFTYINHAKPNCVSNQLYKGIMDDEATGAFTGRIYVAKDAQKTEAYQNNNNILLTDNARMRSKPQLEIYADDVKCSHGATSGQLDEDALFYMKARGIGDKEARMLMMFAFAQEIISKISIVPLYERVHDLVEKRLRGELSRCNNCMMNCKA